jgi:hypothetical protein
MTDIGPVRLIAIGFPPDARFEGRIMAELAELERRSSRSSPRFATKG